MPDRDELVAGITAAVDGLHSVWNRIGLSQDERAEELDSLFRDTLATYQTRIHTEQALCLAYEQEVAKLTRDIDSTMDRLDLVRTADNAEQPNLPLVKQLAKARADFDQLDAKLKRMEATLNAKLEEIHALCQEMKSDVPKAFLTNDKLTAEREHELDQELEILHDEKQARLAHIEQHVLLAVRLMERMELHHVSPHTSPIDHLILRSATSTTSNDNAFQLDVKSIRRLENRVAELDKERGVRETVCTNLAVQLQAAFAAVNEPSEPFLAQYRSGNEQLLGESVIYAYEKELQRLQTVRRERIAEIIDRARDDVRAALEESRPSLMERSRVQAVLSQPVFPEDMDACERQLRQCAQERDKLRAQAERIQPLVLLCQRYLALCKEREQYEALIQDSSRLLSRGRRSDGAVSLQDEERMRKRVLEMPKFLAALKLQVQAFEKSSAGGGGGEPLVMEDLFGEDKPVLQCIDQNERDHSDRVAKEKEQRLRNKQQQQSACGGSAATAAAAVKRVPLATRAPQNSTGSSSRLYNSTSSMNM